MELNRWTIYKFTQGKTARNRIVVPPMASQTADDLGFVTPKTLEHYHRLTMSQAGLVFVEYSFIHPSGRSDIHQLGVNTDDQIPGLTELAKVIHESRALAGMQIVHGGGKSDPQLTGGPLLGPSSIAVPAQGKNFAVPREISPREIEELILWYVQAAARVSQAGFDFIELHSAHGYGLNQWLSPLTNQRRDEYGGSMQNRQRLLLRIVEGIKRQCPELLVSVRIPGQDNFPEGLTSAEMQSVAQSLEKQKVDLIHVSSGIGGWRRPEGRSGEGYLVSDAKKIKDSVKLPVIGVGGIQKGETVDRFLRESLLDFSAVGRAVLENPEKWGTEELGLK